MGTDEISVQQFGGLVENVKTLLKNQDIVASRLIAHEENIRLQLYDSNKRMFDKIDTISRDVGEVKVVLAAMQPVCKTHTDDIAKLKERPGRIIEIGSAAVAGLCAVAMWLTRGH